MTKYNEIMEHVAVTDEMRERVMKNVKRHIEENGLDENPDTPVNATEADGKTGDEGFHSDRTEVETQDSQKKETSSDGRIRFFRTRKTLFPVLGSIAAACAILLATDPWDARKPLTAASAVMSEQSAQEEKPAVMSADGKDAAKQEAMQENAAVNSADGAADATVGVFRMKSADAEAPETAGGSDTGGSAKKSMTTDNMVQAVWDHEEYANREKLEKAVGFTVAVPESLPFTASQTVLSRIGKNLAQVEIYEEEERRMICRKMAASEDCSGNYNRFESEKRVNVDGIADITMKMNGDKVFLAVWTDGTFSWSIDDEKGLSEAEMTEMIRSFGK